MRIYLDHNATTPMPPAVREAVLAAMDRYGNPSSVHEEGRLARALVAEARGQVAELVGASARSVFFNSGATEGANHIIRAGWSRILIGAGEHDCIRAPALAAGAAGAATVTVVPVDGDGVIDLDELGVRLQTDADENTLVCVQIANNETGVVQPIAAVAETVRAAGARLMVDAVQACGKMLVDFETLAADFMLLSSHKIGGPKGVGALVTRSGVAIPALLEGGGQELRQRSGTENVAGIAGFGAAAAQVGDDLSGTAHRLKALRDQLETSLSNALGERVLIVAGQADRLPNTSCLAFPGKRAETLVIGLDLAGFAVSSGSACSSGKVGQSHVLEAMGLSPDLVGSVLRISLGWNNSKNDIDALVTALVPLVERS